MILILVINRLVVDNAGAGFVLGWWRGRFRCLNLFLARRLGFCGRGVIEACSHSPAPLFEKL